MKTITLLLFGVAAVAAHAKSAFQLSGAMESASFTSDSVTFSFSGVLTVDDRSSPPGGPASKFRLVHAKITAKQFSVLSEAGNKYFRQDRAAMETLVRRSCEQGHKIRGGAGGVTLKFSAEGAVESATFDSVSLMNSTITDPALEKEARKAH